MDTREILVILDTPVILVSPDTLATAALASVDTQATAGAGTLVIQVTVVLGIRAILGIAV